MTGKVLAVCLGPGGIPKHPVEEARVTVDGLEGDRQGQALHGGRNRAVCLLSIEEYRLLQADGVGCEPPGAFGENLLVEGLDHAALRPGDRLRVGDQVLLQLHDVREPCGTLRSLDPRFPDLMVGRSGWICRVLEEGTLRPGHPVVPLQDA
jgi:MOSC domain-containing protein YiiM